jgi:uncharacterized protein (TIRG00374 family)
LTSDKLNGIQRIKGSLKYIISIILAAVFLYIAFRGVNFQQVIGYVSHASLLWILILIISNLTSHLLRALRWKVILSSVKKDTSFKNLFGSLMIGYGVNCVVPRLGEITRSVLVGKWENISRSSMLGTVILERVIDMIFFCIAVFLSALMWSENIYINFPWLKSALYLTTFLMLLSFFFLFLIIRFKEKFYNSIVRILSLFSAKLAHKAIYVFEMLIQGFSSLKGTKNYLFTFTLSIIIMLNYALNSYLGFYILGMQNNVTFSMAWVLMSISSIGNMIPTPGGLGSYHVIATKVLVLLFHFRQAESLAYAVLTHFISYFLFIFTAIIMFLLLNKRKGSIFKIIESDIKK